MSGDALRAAFADAFMRHPTGRMSDREVMAVLDAALASSRPEIVRSPASRTRDSDLASSRPEPLDVERLTKALAIAEVNCWANPMSGHRIDDDDEDAGHRKDAEAIAREYDRLGDKEGQDATE